MSERQRKRTSNPRQSPSERDSLNVRVKPEWRGLIDRAAILLGKTRTDFVLEASRKAAEDALSDRTLFAVDGAAYRDFLARLDAPPRANARLKRMAKRPVAWDES